MKGLDKYLTEPENEPDLIELIEKEISQAKSKYGHFNSTHEAYAVLKEEVDEVWDVVKKNTDKVYGLSYWKSKALVKELIQVAAVAIRMADELNENKIKHV